MLALIKLTLMLPGLSAPKMSWVTLPIAPTGVVSVSPVTRQATSASQKDSATAITVSQTGMPKLACPSQASATRSEERRVGKECRSREAPQETNKHHK